MKESRDEKKKIGDGTPWMIPTENFASGFKNRWVI